MDDILLFRTLKLLGLVECFEGHRFHGRSIFDNANYFRFRDIKMKKTKFLILLFIRAAIAFLFSEWLSSREIKAIELFVFIVVFFVSELAVNFLWKFR